MPIALEGMTVLPDLEVVPPVEEWNWTPATTDIDSAIERLFKAETPLSRRTSRVKDIDVRQLRSGILGLPPQPRDALFPRGSDALD